jgi:hypothetical protein
MGAKEYLRRCTRETAFTVCHPEPLPRVAGEDRAGLSEDLGLRGGQVPAFVGVRLVIVQFELSRPPGSARNLPLDQSVTRDPDGPPHAISTRVTEMLGHRDGVGDGVTEVPGQAVDADRRRARAEEKVVAERRANGLVVVG